MTAATPPDGGRNTPAGYGLAGVEALGAPHTMTTRTAALSPRASGLVAAVIACADAALSLPANDNAGMGWRIEDDAAYDDDRAFGVEVVDRNASTLAPVIAAGVPSLWRARHSTSPRSVVTLRLSQPYSRSVNRRVRTLHAMLRAAGVAVEWC